MNKFRLLRADEIECRVSTVKQNGVSILLYKDARCDMRILDETVGALNWQKSYSRDNANCTVSIWDEEKQQWISKEDTGTESFTEKEKGLASDSFKRACFNWGIGRELYTAPFIWIPAETEESAGAKIVPKQNGTLSCYDRFDVHEIAYDEAWRICYLVIFKKGQPVFTFGCPKLSEITAMLKARKVEVKFITESLGCKSLSNLSDDNILMIYHNIDRIEEKFKAWKSKQNS